MSTLALGLQTTFREKLEWLEEMETLLLEMKAARAKVSKSKKKARIKRH